MIDTAASPFRGGAAGSMAVPAMSSIAEEITRYPLTGRFLMGRLRGAMSQAERARLESMVEHVEWIDRPTRLNHRGEVLHHSTMLIEGFILRSIDRDGRRHAVSFHVPGDFVDLHAFPLKRLDHNLDSVGRVKVGHVPHDAISRVMEDEPHLARLFWFSTLLDAAMHREWIMALELMTTPRRIAHILAEVWRRLDMVGLSHPDGFDTPLTQSDLSEICGATAIHTNRALADLRRGGIADFQRGRVTVPDRAALEAYASFAPDYLYGPGTLLVPDEDGQPG